MLQDFWRIIFLLVASLILGLAVNLFHPMRLPIWLREVKEPAIPVWVSKRLRTTDAKNAFLESSEGQAVLVDVRNKEDYQKEHIQGAINLPYYGFQRHYPEFAEKISKKAHLFIYCYHSECDIDSWVAKRLLILGFSNLTLVEEGFLGLKEQGLPTTAR